MNVLLLTSHAIAEYDDLRMLTDLGYAVYSIGGAYDATPFEGKRPALDVPRYPEFEAATVRQREAHAGEPTDFVIDWAKADLAPEVIDWADTIIVHHFPIPWIVAPWARLRHKRVIWRTCGQSDPGLERWMRPLRAQGLQIVRYSPRERVAFERVGAFAGEDAVIRFGKYPGDYGPWTGEHAVVGNVTQDMAGRADACSLAWYLEATADLPARPAGPGSERLPGGIGALDYDAMRAYLRDVRACVYTGTKPASYTLGLIEAMLSGVPVVPIGEDAFGCGGLYEGSDIVGLDYDDPAEARDALFWLLQEPNEHFSTAARERALALFDVHVVGPQWRAFLGASAAEAAA